MIKPDPRIISFTILIIYFEKYMDGILKSRGIDTEELAHQDLV